MLETPNVRDDLIFPIWMLPNGDDGKRRPFHLVHCLAQPACKATLRIPPGRHSRLPPEYVAKLAAQKGWLADKRGYALCPEHKPGANGRPPSDMPPNQKRAAYCAIRDRNIEAAAAKPLPPPPKPPKPPAMDPTPLIARVDADDRVQPVTKRVFEAIAKRGYWSSGLTALGEAARVHMTTASRALTELLRLGYLAGGTKRGGKFNKYQVVRDPPSLPELRLTKEVPSAPVVAPGAADRMRQFAVSQPYRAWKSRREAARAGGFDHWAFNDVIRAAVRAGTIIEERVYPDQCRPFRMRAVDKFDPPAMQPEPKESTMPTEVAESIGAEPPSQADAPRQPTQEDNRRVRDYLDANFDDCAGRWTGDLSDQKAAERLRVPRAWVAAIRTFYGDDTNEADAKDAEAAKEFVADAIRLKDDALSIATRAEELERRARAFLDGRRQ